MQPRSRLVPFIAIALVAAAGGYYVGSQDTYRATFPASEPGQAVENQIDVDLDPVWKTWKLLEDKYVAATTSEKLSKEDRVWGMISGLASAYGDPYTIFLPPQDATSFEQEISGSFGGVGIEIGMREGILTVIAPLKGTPADQAGLLPGDLILEIDGTETQTINIDTAISRIRGEIGTEVVLTIAREGEREFLTIPIVRDQIDIPTLDTDVVNEEVFVIALYNFGGTAVREMRGALRKYYESDLKKLIVDLRGNPGGYLEAAVDIASWFLPAGSVVVTEDYGSNRDATVHRANGNNVSKDDWQIVVLVDRGSASAAEILAGALREHDKAMLIGETTFGKGSVQELVDITDETSLKVTVARWLTPNGHSISHSGLVPDFTVKRTVEDLEAERDPQLDAAVTYLLTGAFPNPVEEATSTEDVVHSEE